MKSSSTVQNDVVGLGGRPAPDTPLAASTMMPGRLDRARPAPAGPGPGRRRSDSSPGAATAVGAGDLVAEQLGQAVGQLAEQLGGGVGLAVPLRVERGVVQAEVGGQVDDPLHPRAQLGHQRLRRPVGQGQEAQVEPVDRRRRRRCAKTRSG